MALGISSRNTRYRDIWTAMGSLLGTGNPHTADDLIQRRRAYEPCLRQ